MVKLSRGRRAARPEPADRPASSGRPEPGSLADLAAMLDRLGAVEFAIPAGSWVYVLFQRSPDGIVLPGSDLALTPFYVGESGKDGGVQLLDRLHDHLAGISMQGRRHKAAAVWLVSCGNKTEAKDLQLMLITRFAGMLINVLGSAECERYRHEVNMLDSPVWVSERDRLREAARIEREAADAAG